MPIAAYHLAQINIARMVAPLTAPGMAGFVNQLEAINALADDSPGFVWRLQTEDGDATALRVFADERILVNMPVWETVEALYEYTYRTAHAGVFRNRKQWFERLDGPHLALWWIPAGQIPSPEEGKQRLVLLAEQGPTPEAFTFKQRFQAQP